MVIWQLVFLVVFGYFLLLANDRLVNELRRLSALTHLGKFSLTALLMAFATSIPELIVGVTSALSGQPTLSLGNILGSNISNLSLVVGSAAVVGGSIPVTGTLLKQELFLVFLAGSLPLLLLLDGTLSRSDAAILLVVYIWFSVTSLRGKTREMLSYQQRGHPFWHRLLLRLNQQALKKHVLSLFFWVFVLVISADRLVAASVSVSETMGVPVLVIGLVFLAVGTTLPELAFEVRAIRERQAAMVYGNLFGSVVVNSTAVLGITALIQPIQLDEGLRPYLLATVAFVGLFWLFWWFVHTKARLERWEGVVLLLVYGVFVFFEFSRSSGFNLLMIMGKLTAPF